MKSALLTLLVLTGAAAPAYAQETACSIPDSVAVRGNSRVSAVTIRGDAAISSGMQLDVPETQRAIRSVFATGQFDDVRLVCERTAAGDKDVLVIEVREKPLLTDFHVVGAKAISARTVRDRITLAVGRPLDAAELAKVMTSIDSLYADRGYYLAAVQPETTVVAGSATLTFRIAEGRRLAVSGIRVDGNSR